MESTPKTWKEKLLAGPVRIPVTIISYKGRLEFQFPYNKALMEEIKVMEGAKYHGYDPNPRKVWTVADSQRNRFQLEYLAGRNPYAWWDQPLKEFTPSRPCMYKHQRMMAATGLTYHYVEWGAEMGTGKTLAAIEVMEQSGFPDWFYIAPKTALAGVRLDFEKWKAKVKPVFMTYEHFVKVMEGWQKGVLPSHGVIFDEFSRAKNHTTQRAQACQHLADAIRDTWGKRGFAIGMSGSPAPKSPADWWSQCEILCPGYLREGRIDKFKQRLALIQMKESLAGGMYPQLVTWWDDENKCKHCGRLQNHPLHQEINMTEPGYHPFAKSVNEVAFLYKRMAGLVHVWFKKDCLDLPEKQYRLVMCPPQRETLNAMRAITAKSPSAVKTLTLLRELSDGFQYKEVPTGGKEVCPACEGKRTGESNVYIGPDYSEDELAQVGATTSEQHPDNVNHPEYWKLMEMACTYCDGSGSVDSYHRITEEVDTPKEPALKDLLDEHEEVGRLVIYGGFTGSVERICSICKKAGWNVIRVDGRGWDSDIAKGGSLVMDSMELLKIFQSKDEEFPRIAFVGQPGAAGMGITLTASPSIVYWSNDFNAESRIQSEDRIHRPGMDINRGATIIDLIHLPSDMLVLNNLKAKRDLQSLTMGQMKIMLDAAERGEDRKV